MARLNGDGGSGGDDLGVVGAPDAVGEGCPPVAVGPVRDRGRGGDDRLLAPQPCATHGEEGEKGGRGGRRRRTRQVDPGKIGL